MPVSFAHPWALLAGLVVVLLVWRWRRRTRRAIAFGSTAAFRGLPIGRGHRAARGEWLSHLGVGACLSLAAAGPRLPDERTRLPSVGASLAIVLDVSASMAERDFTLADQLASRLDAAQAMLARFVTGDPRDGPLSVFPGRPGDALALVTFATVPDLRCPLTLEHSALLSLLAKETPRQAAGEGTTNPGDALAVALRALESAPSGSRAIILATDGEANVPRGLSPLQAAQLAANLNVPVHVIDLAPESTPAGQEADAKKAVASLQAVARMSGGTYAKATDAASLLQATTALDQLLQAETESLETRPYVHLGPWFALAAVLVWSAWLVLERTAWKRLP